MSSLSHLVPAQKRGLESAKWALMYETAPELDASIVPLSIADMEFASPQPVLNRLCELLSQDVALGYALPTERYFEAVINWHKQRHQWEPKSEWIVTSPGVVPALFNAVQSFTEPGDGVIIQRPVYYPFSMAIIKNKRTIVNNALLYRKGRYEMNLDELETLCAQPQNKLLLLCSPHNPTGRVWEPDVLARLVDICAKHNVIIIADEIHHDLVMPGNKHTLLANLCSEAALNKLVLCSAPSKTFNLAGLQCSNIFIPNKELRDIFIDGLERMSLGSLNVLAYEACISAYNECEPWLDELNKLVAANQRTLKARLESELDGVHVNDAEATYLGWFDVGAWGLSPEQLETFMKQEARLYLDEGYIFGPEAEGWERINLACTSEVLHAAIDRLVQARTKMKEQR